MKGIAALYSDGLLIEVERADWLNENSPLILCLRVVVIVSFFAVDKWIEIPYSLVEWLIQSTNIDRGVITHDKGSNYAKG
ncbi:hypothetical protein [Paenibacillus andongensis]|uniref:hypothetical protein n=1 Tax=Paenibacillus andongensis TaxID=2975482 RepID=UPI0021BABCAE|nr:hypothetical protein [Paenibacillus andongensis]